MKRIHILLFLLLGVLPSWHSMAQQYDFEVDGVYYKVISLEDRTVKVVDGTNQYQTIYEEHVNIPANVTFRNREFRVIEIDNSAFLRGKYLYGVKMPDTIEKIGQYVFAECPKLHFVNFSKSLTVIPYRAMYLPGLYDYLPEAFPIPSNIQAIGEEADLRSDCLIIKRGNTPLEVSYRSFLYSKQIILLRNLYNPQGRNTFLYNCKELSIGEKVTSIPSFDDDSYAGNGRYVYGPSLVNIEFGKGLKRIPSFKQAKTLEYITVNNTNPPIAEGFAEIVYLNATLRVPIGTKEQYMKADVWKNFLSVEEYDPSFLPIDSIFDSEQKVEILVLDDSGASNVENTQNEVYQIAESKVVNTSLVKTTNAISSDDVANELGTGNQNVANEKTTNAISFDDIATKPSAKGYKTETLFALLRSGIATYCYGSEAELIHVDFVVDESGTITDITYGDGVSDKAKNSFRELLQWLKWSPGKDANGDTVPIRIDINTSMSDLSKKQMMDYLKFAHNAKLPQL